MARTPVVKPAPKPATKPTLTKAQSTALAAQLTSVVKALGQLAYSNGLSCNHSIKLGRVHVKGVSPFNPYPFAQALVKAGIVALVYYNGRKHRLTVIVPSTASLTKVS